jgi:hypothetical protein
VKLKMGDVKKWKDDWIKIVLVSSMLSVYVKEDMWDMVLEKKVV